MAEYYLHQRTQELHEEECFFCDKYIDAYEEHDMIPGYQVSGQFNARICDRCKSYVIEALSLREDHDMSWADFREYMWDNHKEVALEWDW